jgi:hypothetical protein
VSAQNAFGGDGCSRGQHGGGAHDGCGLATAAADVKAGRSSGVGPCGIGDAITFRVGEGSGGLTQGGSASPEPWRFDPGLDYETPFRAADGARELMVLEQRRAGFAGLTTILVMLWFWYGKHHVERHP